VSDLTHEDVKQILDLLDRAQVDFFQLQLGDLKLVVSKSGPPAGAATPATPAALGAAPQPPPAAPAPVAPPPPTPAPDRAGLVEVRAPMVGTFYAQAEPGAPPYVVVGSAVEEGATMGLVEVMKVYTAVRAPVRGTVAEVLIANTQFAEFGQVLFYLRPAP
jgi:acetyl-CoA carboxylase biotin carboxyl carrier protein